MAGLCTSWLLAIFAISFVNFYDMASCRHVHFYPPCWCIYVNCFKKSFFTRCPGFSWHGVNFPPSSCYVLDLVQEEFW